jgi:hypothetical protein
VKFVWQISGPPVRGGYALLTGNIFMNKIANYSDKGKKGRAVSEIWVHEKKKKMGRFKKLDQWLSKSNSNRGLFILKNSKLLKLGLQSKGCFSQMSASANLP